MKKTGLYGYYDTVNKYVVYIGKDSDVGNNKRYKDHKMPSKYNDQVINIILGRYNKVIKRSVNKKQLDELTNKLNNKEISEKEVKNLRLYDAKERAKNAIQSRIKYNMWNPSCCCYYKTKMLQYNGGDKPKKCFALRHKGKMVPIGFFNEFTSCEIIDSIVKEAVKNEK